MRIAPLRGWLLASALLLSSCNGRVADPPASGPDDHTPSDPALHDIGGPCSRHAQCVSGVCSVNETSACGTCIEAPPLGTSCVHPGRACGAKATCDDGVCESTELPLGASCKFDALGQDMGRCGDHRWCLDDNDENDGEPGTCMPRIALGMSCTGAYKEAPCEVGLVCENQVCVARQPHHVGESCDAQECEPGLYCNEAKTCREPGLPQGATCGIIDGTLIDDDCVAGTTCGDLDFPDGGAGPDSPPSTCVPLPLAGAPCIIDKCAPGLACEDRDVPDGPVSPDTCTHRHAEGEACGVNYYTPDFVCQDGLECRAGICRPVCH